MDTPETKHESQSDQNNNGTETLVPDSGLVSISSNDNRKVSREDIELLTTYPWDNQFYNNLQWGIQVSLIWIPWVCLAVMWSMESLLPEYGNGWQC
ncbi:unnamed protein product [Lactuca saligna]|uniref:Uncharacterized protein n=1 Tax=Lactuca saligna TaxID=75948 RepID=A0AA35ZH76_LACSI|nr:unnamed protein product [Lactuca saligna]